VGLGEYRRKRNFGITSEPAGGAEPKRPADAPLTFVIQKHAASRLHYDFRLELDGVLKSWSVPKGPSLDPTVKRLAVEVEDHPIEYGGFEGIIPKGQYGGGTVLLWDRGVWAPLGDAMKGLKAGNLKFVLKGDKLEGGFALVKLKAGRRVPGREDVGDRGWLLIKERDPSARPEAELDITAARPDSVATRRTMEQIAADRSYVWHSDRERIDPAAVAGARAAPMPARIRPPAVSLRRAIPEGDDWVHEVEVNGQRLYSRVKDGRTQLIDTTGTDWTARTPAMRAIAGAANLMPAGSAVVDGVLAALMPDGSTDARQLDAALHDRGPGKLTYFAVDLPYLDGHDLGGVALERRKDLLRDLVSRVAEPGPLRYSEHIAGNGAAFLAGAKALGATGTVSKRRDAPYRGGSARSPSWVVVRIDGGTRSGSRSKKQAR